MAGPVFENWIDTLGLMEVHDPALEKPTYRKPQNGRVLLAEELENRIAEALRVHRTNRRLSVQKFAKLLGIGSRTYARYETGQSKLTVSRLVHACEALGAHPEDLLEHAAPHLFGKDKEHARLLRLTFNELRKLDTRGLEVIRVVLPHLTTKEK
ncbi:helix-turn-helix domain-containing protein [Mycoplana rhizolycopersici]|uniref:Helix-turn-helix transcriptional regulator n=1 Tax=Mycoplana rhizolycopersici TaxID=2746702 RepID=A0ABX2QJ31_9HYPH|nr:helix-turn-helix transcriptional regulator [Rhizobium rhizolycopersici]NVP57770.1 helix-turn-helix transcriptional regulator [Rhizobium rhizolycopersici]